MRRALFIVLMFLIPLQFAWASAASVCAHEASGAAHFGHHEHAHKDAAQADAQGGDVQAGSLAAHADCGACHGMHSAFVPVPKSIAQPRADRTLFELYAAPVPDGVVDSLLRPPSTLAS